MIFLEILIAILLYYLIDKLGLLQGMKDGVVFLVLLVVVTFFDVFLTLEVNGCEKEDSA